MIELLEQLDSNQIYKRLALSLLESEYLDDILWNIAQDAVAKLGFEDCVVYILENEDTLVQKAAHGPKNPEGRSIKTPIIIPLGQGIVGSVAQTGVSERIADTRLDPRYILDDEVRLSELAVPITYNGQILGVLDSEHSQANYFTEAHLEQFTMIAALSAAKIFHAITREHLDQLNKTLQDSNTRYQQLYEQSPDAIVVHQQNKIIYHNAAFANMVLVKYDEKLANRDLHEFILDKHQDAFSASLRNKADLDYWTEIELLTHYCTRVSVATSSLPIPLPGGNGIQTIFHDITPYKRKERELAQAMQKAEDANQAKTQFLSRISHELRTPLNAIIGFAQIQQIKFPELPEEALRGNQEIMLAGQHLLALVNDVLEISQAEQNKFQVSLQTCDLYPLLEASISLVKNEASKNNVSIITSNFDYKVSADATRLKQVLVNVLINAVKYNKPDGQVLIKAKRNPSNNVEICITDTGIGISKEKLSSIFDPFTRLKEAEQHHFQGAGIGLTLSRALLSEMGGSISAESRLNEGSTFKITLDTPEQHQVATTEHKNESPAAFTQINLDVLYVEDDRASLKLVSEIFALFPNVILHSATDGNAGIQKVLDREFDLIILDMNLPDMTGIDALLQIKPHQSSGKIIALSADALPEHINKAISAGFDFYLTKPLQFSELFSYLNLVNKKTISCS